MTDILEPLRRLEQSIDTPEQRDVVRQIIADTIAVTARLAAGDATAARDLEHLKSQTASIAATTAVAMRDAILDTVFLVVARILPPAG